MKKNWIFFMSGVKSGRDNYEPDKDWATVGTALSADRPYSLGSMQMYEIPRPGSHPASEVIDGVTADNNKVLKGPTIQRWHFVPSPHKEERAMWGKIDRALKRLYGYGDIWTYHHTTYGGLGVTTYAARKQLQVVKSYPKITRIFNETQPVTTPDLYDTQAERACDIREAGGWAKQRELMVRNHKTIKYDSVCRA